MRQNAFFYNAYGLNIKSLIQLPGIQTVPGKTDVKITSGEIDDFAGSFREVDLTNDIKARIIQNNVILLWDDSNICQIKKGVEIVLDFSVELTENYFRLLILGFALPILLHQRGVLSLHANAVNINGGAIALVGPMGIGKSTLSLALHKKGYNLISDDVLAISLSVNNSVNVCTGFNSLKLFPDVIKKMGDDPQSLPKISSISNKRFYNIDKFDSTKFPLYTIYVLIESEDTFIGEISNHQSLMELVKATNWAVIFDKSELHSNLKFCTKIAKQVPIKTLNIHRSLDNISEVVKIIENDYFVEN